MQAYDLIMLVVLGAATLFGMIKGFAWQVASLASVVLSYFVAYNFRYQVAEKIQAQAPWNLFLAMLLLYAGTSFVIWFVFRMVSSSIDKIRLRDFDRQMGALFGAAKGALYCLLITMFAVTLLGERQQQAIIGSKSGHYISRMLAAADGVILPKEVESIVRPHLDRMKQRLEGGAVAGNPAGNMIDSIGQQLNNGSGLGGWLGGQGSATVQPEAVPNGWPTSQQMFTPENVGAAVDAARNAMGWNGGLPPNPSTAGQGGWPTTGGAPLPASGSNWGDLQPSQNSFPQYNNQPTFPPQPNNNLPTSQAPYRDVLPY